MGVALAALPAIAAVGPVVCLAVKPVGKPDAGNRLSVAGIAGAGVSAYGAYETGQATSASDSYQAQVAANNAALAKQQSKLDIQSGEIQAVDQGLKTKATIGQQKAAQGASGIDPNTGSAVAVRAGTAEMGMVDSLTVRSNAAKKAYGDFRRGWPI